MTTHPVKQVAIVIDPRDFDGDPYQVAQRAVAQARALATILAENLDAVSKMARNAELERLLAVGGLTADELRVKAHAWDDGPQGRSLTELSESAQTIAKRLAVLEKAVSYNPKSREARR